jgi:hypothetical protein
MPVGTATVKPACITIRDPCIKLSAVKYDEKQGQMHCYNIEISTINLTLTDYVINTLQSVTRLVDVEWVNKKPY